ncbi:hypothetical protein DSL92_01905 [Billgrantia gudaonensis]|uniref:Uncharacterized protein n=1 Tax=Billgrantia gudaonensis TaxID=376427 RepID=A0A432JKC3_9GAMM|nr:hypothetical protein DSL92_01905 [Halomonas gudaonensis]
MLYALFVDYHALTELASSWHWPVVAWDLRRRRRGGSAAAGVMGPRPQAASSRRTKRASWVGWPSSECTHRCLTHGNAVAVALRPPWTQWRKRARSHSNWWSGSRNSPGAM